MNLSIHTAPARLTCYMLALIEVKKLENEIEGLKATVKLCETIEKAKENDSLSEWRKKMSDAVLKDSERWLKKSN